MIPRKPLDIRWTDLFCGLQACVRSRGKQEANELEETWAPGFETIACLSVRSGFDALLSTLAWPAGSEVLVSAVTIRDMPRLLTEHGLVPVPVDLDFDSLAVDGVELRQAITPKTKGILVAHLFGSRMPMQPIADVAREHGLLLIEDSAQAFTGDGYRGHPEANVSMFSFGPIKTATSLGGGLLRFRDPQLAQRVREKMQGWPRQKKGEFCARLMKYGLLVLLANRAIYTIFTSLPRHLGIDHDSLIGRAVRGFAGGDFLAKIRRQPSFALLALMKRRISQVAPDFGKHRAELGREACHLLEGMEIPGRRNTDHSFWVFPILHDDPEGLRRHLAAAGFDATCGGSSLHVVPLPEPGAQRPARAEQAFPRLLYLPIYPGITKREIARLATGIVSFAVRGRGLCLVEK